MTERDRAAVHVELVVIDAEVFRGRQHLGREGFIYLDKVNVVDGHARTLHGLTACFDRAEAHDLGVQPRHT